MSNKMKIAIRLLGAYAIYGEYVGVRNYYYKKKLKSRIEELKNSNKRLSKAYAVEFATNLYLVDVLNRHGITMDEFDQMALSDIHNRF